MNGENEPKPGPEFIVAEVSKNWNPHEGTVDGGSLISMRFQHVIARNLERGYELHSWRLSSLAGSSGGMNETIVAVFRRKRGA